MKFGIATTILLRSASLATSTTKQVESFDHHQQQQSHLLHSLVNDAANRITNTIPNNNTIEIESTPTSFLRGPSSSDKNQVTFEQQQQQQQQPLLKNIITNNKYQNDFKETTTTTTTTTSTPVLECVPSSYGDLEPSADIGILDCPVMQYCMESSNSSLGGVCVVNSDSDEDDKNQHYNYNNDHHHRRRRLSKKRGLLNKLKSLRSDRYTTATTTTTTSKKSVVECNPDEVMTGDQEYSPCPVGHSCMKNADSNLGGFCYEIMTTGNNSPSANLDGFRDLQSSYTTYSFFGVIEYICGLYSNPSEEGYCSCEAVGDDGFSLSCFLESDCEKNVTSPCLQEYKVVEICPAYRIDGTGTSQDYTLKLCYEHVSPFQFEQCYQIDVVSGLRTCTFNLGDEVCQQCGFNATDNTCIEFDCTNTASNTIGDTCNNEPLSELLYLDLFDCPGACNICGDNEKLLNPNLDISPTIGYNVDCYLREFCSMNRVTCTDAQSIAFAGGLNDDTCEVAPGVDISTQCCDVSRPETVTPESPPEKPPETEPETSVPEPETQPPAPEPETQPPDAEPETPAPDTEPGTQAPDTPPNLSNVNCADLNWDCFGCIEKGGCYWCPGDGLCTPGPSFTDSATAVIRNNSCTVPGDFVTDTCTSNDNFFSDPLYSSQKWIFDMINLKAVWDKGYFGNGIRVRVNDEGFETR
jgi:hypothetical protein